jgi:tRNA dimethylallyltransferase
LTKTVIIIAGPTAVGKTGIAIEIAKHFSTEIISADSRQCYKELDIGVARPSEVELASVPHYFIASHSIHQPVNAGVFEQYALEKTAQIFKDKNLLVMVGGTGLYIKAFCEGIDEIPTIRESIRNEIIAGYNHYGLSWLQEQVKNSDPEFYAVGEIQNPQRLMRALEVFKTTGKSILYFRKGKKAERNFNIIKLALELPKELLHQNINNRVDAMIEAGLLNEVKSLMPYQHLNALQTVGYKELFDYLNGMVYLTDAIASIKKHTRQYAKRQLTWFKKDKEYTWFHPPHLQKIKEHLSDALIYK